MERTAATRSTTAAATSRPCDKDGALCQAIAVNLKADLLQHRRAWARVGCELCPLLVLGDPRLSDGCRGEWANRNRVVLRADDLHRECIVDRDEPIGRLGVGVARLRHAAHPFLRGSNKEQTPVGCTWRS